MFQALACAYTRMPPDSCAGQYADIIDMHAQPLKVLAKVALQTSQRSLLSQKPVCSMDDSLPQPVAWP
jgi:hypothetical protein